MIWTWIISVTLLLTQDTIPFKPNDQFELKLDYDFKQRPADDKSTIYLQDKKSPTTSLLPYLAIQLTVLKLHPEETRLKIISNDGRVISNKRIQQQQTVKFDMGFTSDLKDRVMPHEYTILFLSDKKKEMSRIVVSVAQDGTFLVNEQQRGRL